MGYDPTAKALRSVFADFVMLVSVVFVFSSVVEALTLKLATRN
jgi:hypothetical protein